MTRNRFRIKCGMTPNQIRQGIGPIGTGQAGRGRVKSMGQRIEAGGEGLKKVPVGV